MLTPQSTAPPSRERERRLKVWCWTLQVKLCDPCLSALRTRCLSSKVLYKSTYLTFTFTFTGYTPAKFHICIFNGCNAIVLTTFSWLSGTNKQTNIITPAKILASRNHLNGGPHYNKCFLSHFLVCRHTHTHTHTHTDRQTDRQTEKHNENVTSCRYRGWY